MQARIWGTQANRKEKSVLTPHETVWGCGCVLVLLELRGHLKKAKKKRLTQETKGRQVSPSACAFVIFMSSGYFHEKWDFTWILFMYLTALWSPAFRIHRHRMQRERERDSSIESTAVWWHDDLNKCKWHTCSLVCHWHCAWWKDERRRKEIELQWRRLHRRQRGE